ncbi:MAG: DNA polymerase III subunit epsilon [Planctomycetes bacterium]|nr:DNA polymerase III subunit epsilon [Planctomycetota bacterium]
MGAPTNTATVAGRSIRAAHRDSFLRMILQLERPLVFLDFETTGLDVKNDRILELAFIRLLPDGTREEFVQRINPGIEVSKTAAKITGVHSNDAMGLFWGPPLKKVGDKLLDFLGDSDIAGFNQINYDMPLWRNECRRHEIAYEEGNRAQVDVKVIFNVCEKTWDRFLMGPRNLSAAVRHYCGRELEGAHAAEHDTHATIDVLLAQLERHTELPRDVKGLSDFCLRNSDTNRDDEPSEVSGGAGL